MSIKINGEEYIYKKEFAEALGISMSTLVIKIRSKEVPLPIKLESTNIWKKSDIDSYLEREGK